MFEEAKLPLFGAASIISKYFHDTLTSQKNVIPFPQNTIEVKKWLIAAKSWIKDTDKKMKDAPNLTQTIQDAGHAIGLLQSACDYMDSFQKLVELHNILEEILKVA